MVLSKKQLSILRYIHKKQRTVGQIYKRFRLEYSSFYTLTAPIEECFIFLKSDPYEKSAMQITDYGAAMVDGANRRSWQDVRAWITLAIALVALVLSIISLIWQAPIH